MFDLSARRALVTGAATGLGQTIAEKLAAAGCSVAVTDLPGIDLSDSLERCRAAARGAGGEGARPEDGRAATPAPDAAARFIGFPLDVRDLEQIRDGIERAQGELGGIDILVNNAGINRPTPGLEVDGANWGDHFDTNVRGGFFCAQAAAPSMIERGFGRIVFISSQSGLIGIPGQPVYCATKGALINLVRSLGVEWAKHGITVNSVAPTFVDTNLTHERLEDPEFRAFVLGKIPAGRLATREDVAHAVVYLASDEAGMVNCFNLSVDGGWTAW